MVRKFDFSPIGRTLLCMGLMLATMSCSKSAVNETGQDTINTDRTLSFSGMDWIVRTSGTAKQGPGPNLFSDAPENVWVDEQGRLHLKIVQKGGFWYCAGVILRRSMGYGQYVFYISSDVSKLDQNVVAGLFTYKNDHEEIDIEFSRWSVADNKDSQFAVQPSDRAGNKVRYDLNLLGTQSTHAFNWQPDRIDFISLQGHGLSPKPGNLIQEWTYTGDDIPPKNEERLRMNLWLFRGAAPSDQKEQEIIIEKVEFIKK